MQKFKNIFYTHRILLLVSVIFIAGGAVFQWLYVRSSDKTISISDLEYIISQKEQKADAKITQIKNILEHKQEDSLRWLAFEPLDDAYFIYKNDKLIFWTNNQLKRVRTSISDWKFYAAPNAYVLAKRIQVNDYQIVSYILLKHNYPYENNELSNDFAEDFELNKNIQIVDNKPKDKYAVYNGKDKNNYLFTLQLPAQKVYDESKAKIALILFSIGFLLLFYLYAHLPLLLKKRYFIWKEFFLAGLGMLLLVYFCLSNNVPLTFFRNSIFTSFHYAANTLLATLTHLAFFTAYVFSTIFLYSYYVKRGISDSYMEIKKVALLLLPAFYFLLMFYILMGLVFNSSTYLNVLRVDDISITTVWNHFLLLVWGVGYMLLFIKTHNVAKRKGTLQDLIKIDILLFVLVATVCFLLFDKYAKEAILFYLVFTVVLYLPEVYSSLMKSLWFLAIYLGLFALFVVNNSIKMNSDKKINQYRLLAENLYFNESSQDERFTESMLEDLDKNLTKDNYFKKTAVFPDSVETVNNYLNNKYLRGYWNKYEMKLFATYPQSEIDKSYQDLIESRGNFIWGTHFYKINAINTDISYLGAFKTYKNNRDSVHIFMEFYPRSNYKSYSYPNLLVESPPTVQSQLSLSVSRYSHNELVYSSGKFKYPRNGKWILKQFDDFFTQDFAKSRHYIYAPSKYNYLVISEGNIPNLSTYFIYFIYTFVVFLLVCLSMIWIYNLMNRREKIRYTLTSKLLIAFISLMVVCFVAIFYVSLTYTQKRYKEKQLTDIGLKKSYIQSALQEKYYWTQRLDSTNTNALNFDLQDLSYTYQTDINVYDNNGMLVGTSQPVIFSKNLISKLISPKPYFSNNPNIDQYENIGKLEYLATYSDFLNGDNLPIGYISIPQFLSKDEYNADVQSFLVAIAHISLIIILLFILLSILIGRRLTAPLTIIETRLKDIRLGKENKKIDYRANDEVGQLVAQYNRTVDELERSAQLLASSERESAWKQMARQVAHEINNPLTPMKLTIQQLQRTKSANDERFDLYFDKSTNTLIEQIESLSQIASTFSTFARLPEPKFIKVDVAKKATLVTQLFSSNNDNIRVTYNGVEEGVFALTDREQLIQVFNNLLKNAVQAIPADKKGEIDVRLNYTDKVIDVYFEDNGKGVSEDIKDKLFTPNFTTKSTGMGLGLAISKNIIRTSGGDITFESTEGSGAVFHVRLPRMH
ncbi:Integral membrane sensor signal transduction histidine kinase [uncultured Paludibacter sp.]|nr:Integral membrane sensor signal transduction histidine kinase [uncultured Paludibacter sp.]